MSSSTLTSLPAEILTRICECVEHLPSLAALASTSKHMHSIANPLLFHDVHFTLVDRTRLEFSGTSLPSFMRQVQDCRALLQRRAAFRRVRRLFVDERTPGDPEQVRAECLLRNSTPSFTGDPLPTLDVLDMFSEAALPKAIHCILRRPVTNDFDTTEDTYIGDSAWQPLARLLGELTGLRELHFSCRGQFPPCLLQALHRDHLQPRCKLFLNAFRLRSLLSPTPDPHELQLVTSPCLHRIRMACWHRQDKVVSAARPDDADVVRYLVGMAPNLKEVLLDHNLPKHFHRRNDALGPESLPWVATTAPHPTRTSLETLLLSGNGFHILPKNELEQWMASTDFSRLRMLGLSYRTGVSLEMLQLLATDSRLSSLTTLVLSLGYHEPSYHHAAERVIGSLPRLSTLHILYFGQRTPALLRLAPGLRTFSMRGHSINTRDICQLGEDCPLLEELGITLNRSMGNKTETGWYKMLGKSLPRLKKLALSLDVQLPLTADADPSFDEFDRERYPGTDYLNGHLRDWFISNAMDEALARAIFQTISSGKVSPNSHGHVPLEVLKIQFLGGWARYLQIPGLPRLEPILSQLRNPWLLTRSIRDDRNDIVATTSAKTSRPKSLGTGHAEGPLSGPYLILDRIWPSHGETWPWKWKSRPLEESSP